jgi:hypothetical protein
MNAYNNYKSMLKVLGILAIGVLLSLPIGLLLTKTPNTDVYSSLTSVNTNIYKEDGDAKIVIKAPTTGEVGELVRLDVSESRADDFKWILVPSTVDFEIYDDGKKAVFSARKPGDYMFIVACSNGGSVDVATCIVTITGNAPAPPDSVVPVVPDPGAGATLTQTLPYWCSQQKRPQKEALQLAASFDSVAASISAGVNTDPRAIVELTAQTNRQALGASMDDWLPVLQRLQQELKLRAESGTLRTAEDHAQTWREIAQGLKNYAALFN